MQASLVVSAEGWLLDSGNQNLSASREEACLHPQLLTAVGDAEENIFFSVVPFRLFTDSCREGSQATHNVQPFTLSSRWALTSLPWTNWPHFFPLEGTWKEHLPCWGDIHLSVQVWPWWDVWGSGLSSCGDARQDAHPQESGCGLQAGLGGQVGIEWDSFHTLLTPAEPNWCPKLPQSWAASQRGGKAGSDYSSWIGNCVFLLPGICISNLNHSWIQWRIKHFDQS